MRRPELVAIAALVVVGAPARTALAYCRTSSCPDRGTASVCVPSQPGDCGVPLFWPTSCVGFSMQQDASSQIGLDAATEVIATAFDTWSAADCGTGSPQIKVTNAGTAACASPEYNQDKGNANVIMFRDDGWPYEGSANTLALTTVTYDLDSGAIYDADMELNSHGAMFTTGDTNVVFDLRSITQHETGHFLGLAHSPDHEATMYAAYKMGDTSLRSLSPDDIAAICSVYPPPPAAAQACEATPRHGFSTECGAEQSAIGACCAVAPGADSDPRSAALAAAIGALALTARRRRRNAL